MPALTNAPLQSFANSDAALVRRALAGDAQAVREIIRFHNQRLYRLVRAVLHSNVETEDALQDTYLQAFAKLEDFNADASLSTWLARIALNTAFMRLRAAKRLKRSGPPPGQPEAEIIALHPSSSTIDPERGVAQRELLRLVEEATDALSQDLRIVFVARVIEGLGVEETAALLNIPAATVKTRLHRARKLIRARLEERIGPILMDAFPFAGRRCERLTEAVIVKLGLQDQREPL
ncbi:RNA polymerase sigma factor [Rhizobium cauense]|uniref:RNA polymerase sigma factor n=1 Tax=Rhizobium cauense TaxID=1166683 RepID=UPI001C6F15F9|nr:RNA polymerase sigma factor [Rhizobium cauense]MBW9114662.1 RNA polymerase sigma factor [Rhizobium cauense]